MAIPKIIHQTYKSHDLPAEIKQIVQSLRHLNPNWEYRFYTDRDILDYIKQHFDERTLVAYLRINPVFGAARADLFRYLVLYREGGVYLDIKSTCVKPLDQVIEEDDTFIVTQWQNENGQKDQGAGLFSYLVDELKIKHGEYQQWFIIAEVGSPFIKKVVDDLITNILEYRPWYYGLNSYGKRGVLFLTGPIAYTKSIHEIMMKYHFRYERYDKNLSFVYNALQQSHTKVLPNHYSKHKTYIVSQGWILNIVFNLYILYARLMKSILKSIGKWKD